MTERIVSMITFKDELYLATEYSIYKYVNDVWKPMEIHEVPTDNVPDSFMVKDGTAHGLKAGNIVKGDSSNNKKELKGEK